MDKRTSPFGKKYSQTHSLAPSLRKMVERIHCLDFPSMVRSHSYSSARLDGGHRKSLATFNSHVEEDSTRVGTAVCKAPPPTDPDLKNYLIRLLLLSERQNVGSGTDGEYEGLGDVCVRVAAFGDHVHRGTLRPARICANHIFTISSRYCCKRTIFKGTHDRFEPRPIAHDFPSTNDRFHLHGQMTTGRFSYLF